MTDTPKIHDTLDSLDSEAGAEPYVFGIKNKRITFPDPGLMGFQEAEDFLREMSDPSKSITDTLERWLSEQDAKTLVAAKLNFYQMLSLLQKAQEHYEKIFGEAPSGEQPGESGASRT